MAAEIGRYRQIWHALEQHPGCQVIQNNFELPPYAALGNMDAVAPGGMTRFVLRLNAEFAAEAGRRSKLFVQDVQGLSARFGLQRWFDWSRYFSYKVLQTPEANVVLSQSLVSTVRARAGPRPDFVICLGSKGYMVKEFFANYFLHTADVTFDMVENRIEVHQSAAEPWKVTPVDTGEDTGTGGRLKRIQKHLSGESSFCMTYGDTVSEVNIGESIHFHKKAGKLATLTAVQSQPRFGILGMQGGDVHSLHDIPSDEGGRVNRRFYVLSPKILDLIPMIRLFAGNKSRSSRFQRCSN